jgi:hypothetical protein
MWKGEWKAFVFMLGVPVFLLFVVAIYLSLRLIFHWP